MKQQKKKAVLYLLAGLVICGAVLYPLAAGEPAALEGSAVQPLSGQTAPEETDIAKKTPKRSVAQSPSNLPTAEPEENEEEEAPAADMPSSVEEKAISAPAEPETEPDTMPAEQSDASALEREPPAVQEDSPPEVIGCITTVEIPQDTQDAYLIERWLVDGKYPRNQFGESYGPQSLAKYAGEEPDLIPVRSTNGEWGYARAEDFNGPEIHTLEDAAAYMENLPDSWAIPVYDLEGNVIGKFVFESGTLSDDEIREALDR